MPLIDVSLASGRSPEQIRALISALHKATEESIGAASDNITIIIREVEKEHWSRNDTTITEFQATSTATD